VTRRLVVTTRLGLPQGVLEEAIARAAVDGDPVTVVVPVFLPPTLPISAAPAKLARRVAELEERARRALADQRCTGRVIVTPCRDHASVVWRLCRPGSGAEIVLAGSASWALRRSLHRLGALTAVIPSSPSGARPLAAGDPRMPVARLDVR